MMKLAMAFSKRLPPTLIPFGAKLFSIQLQSQIHVVYVIFAVFHAPRLWGHWRAKLWTVGQLLWTAPFEQGPTLDLAYIMQKVSSPLFDLSLVYALGLGKPGDEPCHLRKQADPVRDPEHFPERILASAFQLRCVRAQQDWMWGCSKWFGFNGFQYQHQYPRRGFALCFRYPTQKINHKKDRNQDFNILVGPHHLH